MAAVRSTPRAGGLRGGVALVATLLAVVAWVCSAVVGLLYVTVTDTDRFVARFGPTIEDPTVAAGVAAATADAVVTGVGLSSQLEESIPAVLAGPLARAAENTIARSVTAFLATDAGRHAWDQVLTTSQQTAVAILEGSDTQLVTTGSAGVTLELGPLVAATIERVEGVLSELLGRDVDLVDASPEDLAAYVAAAEERYGITLPESWGTITVFSASELERARSAYAGAQVLVWALPAVAAALTATAVVASRRRWSALGWIVALTAAGLAVVALMAPRTEERVADRVAAWGADPVASASIGAGYAALVEGLRTAGVLLAVSSGVLVLILVVVRYGRSSRTSGG